MRLTVPVRGEVHIIPPGKRKPRAFLVRTAVEADIPETEGERVPVALRVRENPDSVLGARWPEQEFRWDGENLWKTLTTGQFGDGDPITSEALRQNDPDALRHLFGQEAVEPDGFTYGYENRRPIVYSPADLDTYFEGGNYRIVEDNPLNTQVNRMRSQLRHYMIVDGLVTETETREPGYEVDRGPAAGQPSVKLCFLDRHHSAATRRGDLFLYRADDYERAEQHALALGRMDRDMDPPFFSSDDIVDVFEPAALSAKPEVPALYNSGHKLMREMHNVLGDHPRNDVADGYVWLARTLARPWTFDPVDLQEVADAMTSGIETLRAVGAHHYGASEIIASEAELAVERARARFDLVTPGVDDPGPDPVPQNNPANEMGI